MNNIVNNHKEYPVCIVPPEQHYGSYQQLVKEIKDYETRRAYFYQENPDSRPPVDKFEIVRSTGTDITRLFPTALDYGILYRGQSGYFNPCLPTLYREELSELELFVNQVKMVEFEMMVDRFKITQRFKEKGWFVDYVGLAQHYGLKTDVLDFTSDINIAMFFAMCDFDKKQNEYKPKQEDVVYTGYLYAMPTLDNARNEKDFPFRVFSDSINPIGLQPFKRPGAQKGFSLHFKDQHDFIKGYLYSFNYTQRDSQDIFNRFNQGKSLWCDDIIADLAHYIDETKTFSYHAISVTVKRLRKDRSIKKWISILKGNGYKIVTPNRLKWYYEDIEDDSDIWRRIQESTVQRSAIVGIHKYPCIDTNYLGREILTNLMYGCLDAPTGYNSGYKFIEESEQGLPIYGLETETVRRHMEPDSIDKKIHVQWKVTLPVAPQTRSFNFPDAFKSMRVVNSKL